MKGINILCKSFQLIVIIIVFTQCNGSTKRTVYNGTIGQKEILTPKPKKRPVINGANIYGARPGKKFIYRIPCQGERPIKFSVYNLPEELSLDHKKGIITGIVPKVKGEYCIIFRAENKHGNDTRSFKLVVGDKLALTPPTGYNTWGGHMIMISDSLMRYIADVFVDKGLADVGYQYLGIDDCWERITKTKYDSQSKNRRKNHEGFPFDERTIDNVRDNEGNICSNDLFPDMKGLTEYIHQYGLKAGIYSTPGITTCQDFEGSINHQEQDANRFADWGFDFVKYDLCSGSKLLKQRLKEDPEYRETAYWSPMINYLQKQNRDIVFNMCTYTYVEEMRPFTPEPWEWAPEIGVHTWRFTDELNHDLHSYFDIALRLSTELRNYLKPGSWADPDYMYIHYIRDWAAKGNPSEEIFLNTNERYQYVTLWSMVCAPFFFSCDMYKIDEFTLGLLSNADVFNINQDELCHVAETVKNEDNQVIMIKKMVDGSKAVALFNRDHYEGITMTIDFKELGLSNEQEVYDVWRQKEIGSIKNGMSVQLSPSGVAYFLLKE